MATIFADGFEIKFANNSVGLWDSRGNGSSGSSQFVASFPRTGTGTFSCNGVGTSSHDYRTKALPSALTEVYFGFSFQANAVSTGNADGYAVIFHVENATADQVYLCIHETTKYLAYLRGDGTVLGTSGEALSMDAIHYLEGHIVISNTVGEAALKVDGVSKIALTSQDTHNSGNVEITHYSLGLGISGRGNLGTWYFDDFVINDTTGTTGNSWTDGAKVEMLVPSADGNYTAWTSTGGAVDYTQIDDVATYGNLPDGDTTMLSSITTSQRTSVALTNTTVSGTVMALQVMTNVRGENTAVDQMGTFFRISSTDYDNTAFAPTVSYAWKLEPVPLSPATSAAWTTAEIDGSFELGFLRVT